MILANMTPAQHARAAAKEAWRLCAGQSITARVGGVDCRAIGFRVKAGVLQIRSLHGPIAWRTVDCDAEYGRPIIFDQRGELL